MIYGYVKQETDVDGLLELKEVTFHTTPKELRRIAEFLMQSAGEIERGSMRPGGHAHLSIEDRDWKTVHPETDVIVCFPGDKTADRMISD